ncbi:hypothetical protein QET40_10530 [Akkermansia sp. N21169]|uniref:hypothetical protein n=1 Tax=Akkermansia sp. N21169 TaxID=3040765 RepID=UPI00244EBE47|nr:hypothetical protein [Akkermansia sp. N21169]MDH3069543.1 hypothetical protein [Akkermansia sp. N21169]
MKRSALTSLAAALAVMGSIASADVVVPAYCTAKPGAFKATVSAGYEAKYISRGLVLADSSTDNVIPIEITGQYNLQDNFAIVGGLRYDWMTANSFEHHRDSSALCDEGTFLLGLRKGWNPALTTTLGYQFVHGGLPGALNTHRKGKRNSVIFDSNQPEEHSLVFDVHYDFGQFGNKSLKGLFADVRLQYTAQWMSGWWYEAALGYKFDLCPHAAAVVSAKWTASSGYFDSTSLNSNGTQGFSLNLDLPCKVSQHVTVTPFVSTIWAGNGAIAAGKRAEETVYRNFTVNLGVSASYTF